MLLELCYVGTSTLITTSYRDFYLDILPEANCCCLQTYTVNYVLLSMHTLASVRRSYRRVINARYSVVYSSLASSLFSKHKLSNGAAVPRRRATSCLPLVYPHVMYHPRPSTFSRSFPPLHGRTINARN